MRVIRASVMGYCMGVRKAIDSALREAAQAKAEGISVWSIGPLIHNPQAASELERAGVRELECVERGELPERETVEGAVGIIRAHGIPPDLRSALTQRGMRLFDATCVRVIASQKKAKALSEAGIPVVLAGDRDHGELVGIAGYAPGCFVAGSPEEARALGLACERVAVIAQTTIKREEYDSIIQALAETCGSVEAFDSICPATKERQDALASLLGICQAVIVVGGRDSANTRRLLDTAARGKKPAWLAETARDLPREIFAFDVVGVTAGASTPDYVVDQVVSALEKGKPVV